MSSKVKIAFNEKKQLIGIETVANGLSCNCLCIDCGARLIARQGFIRDHHFAHYNSTCSGSLESYLHKLGKIIIQENNSIKLPFMDNFLYHECTLETNFHTIRPDVIISDECQSVIIEIRVSHKVNPVKEHKIQEIGIPAFEIDLSSFDYDVNRKTLENWILESIFSKKTIYFPNKPLEEDIIDSKEEDSKDPINYFLLIVIAIAWLFGRPIKNWVKRLFRKKNTKR